MCLLSYKQLQLIEFQQGEPEIMVSFIIKGQLSICAENILLPGQESQYEQLQKEQQMINNQMRRKSMLSQLLQDKIMQYGAQMDVLNEGDTFIPQNYEPIIHLKHTFIPLEQLQLCVLYKKDYDFCKEELIRNQLIVDFIPMMERMNYFSKESLLNCFKPAYKSRGQYITKEGDGGDHIYIFNSGKLRVEKQIQDEKIIYYDNYQHIQVCSIDQPCYIGEEIIFQNDNNNLLNHKVISIHDDQNKNLYEIPQENYVLSKYQFSVIVESPTCKLYQIRRNLIKEKLPHEIIAQMYEQFLVKEKSRNVQFLKNKGNSKAKSFYSKIDDISHTYNYLQNSEMFMRLKNHEAVDNFNRKNLVQKVSPDDSLFKDEVLVQEGLMQPNVKVELEKELNERQMKKELISIKSAQILRQELLLPNIKKQKSAEIKNVEQLKQIISNLKNGLVQIDDISISKILGEKQDDHQIFQKVKSPLFQQLQKQQQELLQKPDSQIVKEKKRKKQLEYEQQLVVNEVGQFIGKDIVLDIGWPADTEQKQYFKLIALGQVKQTVQVQPPYQKYKNDQLQQQKDSSKMYGRFKQDDTHYIINNINLDFQQSLNSKVSKFQDRQKSQSMHQKRGVSRINVGVDGASYYIINNKNINHRLMMKKNQRMALQKIPLHTQKRSSADRISTPQLLDDDKKFLMNFIH